MTVRMQLSTQVENLPAEAIMYSELGSHLTKSCAASPF